MMRRDSTVTVTLRTLEPTRATRSLQPAPTRLDRRVRLTRRGRAVSSLILLAVALFGFLFSGGIPGTQIPEAKAWPWDSIAEAFCNYSDRDSYRPQPQPWPGVIGFLGIAGREVTEDGSPVGVLAGGIEFNYLERYGADYEPTAYEWWGTAGLEWQSERYKDLGAECIPIATAAGNIAATIVNNIGLGVGEIGLTVFGWASDINAVDPFLQSINEIVWTLTDALFLEYLIPIVMLGALWIGWQGLVKKRSSEALQGIAWMVLAAGASMFFLINPAWITASINSVVATVQAQITGATVSIASGQDSDLCSLRGETANTDQYRVAQCQIWQTFMFAPWAAGQFGPVADSGITVPETFEADGQAYQTQVRIPGRTETNNLVLVYLDSQTFNHNQTLTLLNIDTDSPAFGVDEVDLEAAVNKKKAQWTAVYDTLNQPTLAPAHPFFTGNDWSGRLGIAFVNLLAMAVGAFPIMFLAFTLVIMQLGFVLLILAAPLFLTLGIHPGFGRKVALGWLEMIISISIKRIATSVLLAILLAAFMAVTRSGDSWIVRSILVGAISIAMLVYRKRLLDSVSRINLGGDGNGISGAGQQMLGKAKSKAMRGTTAAMGRSGGEGGGVGTALTAGLVGGFAGQVFGRRIATKSAMKQRKQAQQQRQAEEAQQRAWSESQEVAAASSMYDNDMVFRGKADERARELWTRRMRDEDDAYENAARRIMEGRSTVEEEVRLAWGTAQRNKDRGVQDWNVVPDVSGINPEFAAALQRQGLELREDAEAWTRPGSSAGAPQPSAIDLRDAITEMYRQERRPSGPRAPSQDSDAGAAPPGPQRPY